MTVGVLEGLTSVLGDELTDLSGLRQTRLTAALVPETLVQGGLNTASGTIGSAPVLQGGTWTWNGSTTVLATDTSGVLVGDFIRLDSDGQLFEISVIVPNVSVTILNPGALTIPTGVGATSEVGPTVVTLSAGSFVAGVIPGTRFRVLTGALAGRTALVNTVDSATQLTLRTPIGSPPAVFAGESWEVVVDAQTTADVESVLDWPAPSGRVIIEGILYTYSARTNLQLQGLQHYDGTAFLDGAAQRHEPLTVVTDLTESYSALEQVRRGLLVDYAEGADLNVIGRNLGALRPAALVDDDVYRELLKAIAYVSKGTELALERALEALLGETQIQTGTDATAVGAVVTLNAGTFLATVARGMRFYLRSGPNAGKYTLIESRDSGTQITLQTTILGAFTNLDWGIAEPNWEIFEDLTLGSLNHPCTVFFRRTDDDSTQSVGKTFLDGDELQPTTGAAAATLPAAPIRTHGIRLAPEPGQFGERRIASGLTASGVPGVNQTVAVTGPASSFPTRILPGDVFEVLAGPLAGQRATVVSRNSDVSLTLGPLRNHAVYTITQAFTNVAWRVIRLVSSFRNAKPSAEVYEEYAGDPGTTEWLFVGAGGATEGANALLVDGASGQYLAITTTAPETARYRHPLRVRPESRAQFSAVVSYGGAPASGATTGLQWGFEIRDGAKRLFVGLIYSGAGTVYNIGFVNTATGAFISGTVTTIDISVDGAFITLTLKKFGTSHIELHKNGRFAGRLAYSNAGLQATADMEISFGVIDAVNDTADFLIREADWKSETDTDYWNVNIADGSLTAAERLVDNTASGLFLVGDVGKRVRIYDWTALNGSNGNPRGEWEIESFISADEVQLRGVTKRAGTFTVQNLSRFIVRDQPDAFVWPDHRGHSVEILTGPNAGVYAIQQILDPVTFQNVETGLTRTAALSSTWTSAAAVQTELRSNAVLLDTAGGVPARPNGFTPTDDEADWRLVPNFAVDAGPVPYALVDAGTQAGVNLTTRQNFPFATGTVVAIQRSAVLSGQVLDDRDDNAQTTPPAYDFYPFYLADRWGFVRDVLKKLTDAGIKADFDHLSRDDAGPHLLED